MRFGLLTWGTNGDVRPFFALAAALQQAGHEATLVVCSIDCKDYRSLASRLGVDMRHVAPSYGREGWIAFMKQCWETPGLFEQANLLLVHALDPVVPALYEEARRLLDDNDVLIGHFVLHPAAAASEKMGKPAVCVTLNPILPSRDIPPMGAPNLGPWLNPLLWRLTGRVMDRLLLPHANPLRVREGLKPWTDTVRLLQYPEYLDLIAVSPTLARRPVDWSEQHQMCGFLSLPDDAEAWQMPPDLQEFLDEGESPVFLTFGSMVFEDASEASRQTRYLLEAVAEAECRAIVQADWGHGASVATPRSVYRAGPLPHHRVFPHCAAVVHHGGAGTTQTALAAGCASIVVAHGVDQEGFGRLLWRAGVAPRPLNRKTASTRRLAQAIRRVLAAKDLKERAVRLALKMKSENGPRTAVTVLERRFGKPT